MKKFVLYKHLGRNFPNNKIYYSGSIYTSQYNQQNVYIENATIFTNEQLRELFICKDGGIFNVHNKL